MASTATRRLWYERYACEKAGDFPEVNILGYKREVCPATVDAWLAFSIVLIATGYKAISVGTQNCRPITGGTKLSLHAYGIAIDIDPFDLGNPYYATGTRKGASFSWNDTKFTGRQIAAVEAIRSLKGNQVWRWGGRWSLSKDYMHFEIDVPPDELDPSKGGGINWSTVTGGTMAFTAEEEAFIRSAFPVIKELMDVHKSLATLQPPSSYHAVVPSTKLVRLFRNIDDMFDKEEF